jgi:uncharacterized membrane protein YhhN
MNAATLALFVVAAGFAIGDWISRARDDRRLEVVCKPATLVALAAAAITLDPGSGTMRTWFVFALVLSLLGDVLLMLPSDRFVAGLGAFLLAHLAYVGGFVDNGLDLTRVVVGAIAVAVVVGPIGVRIVRGARVQDRALAVPVALYIAVISAMIVCAAGSGRAVAIAGAALFAFSDSVIGWTRFVASMRHASVVIMVTYHLGQALLVLALL